MTAPILVLENVSKSYGVLRVTDQLSVHLDDGEALGVIGPNGAGKSTMFNLIGGNVRPDAGRILFEGRDISNEPPFRRCKAGIARSYQIPHPFVGMTVFENLLVGAAFGRHTTHANIHDDCLTVLDETGLLPKANVAAGALTLLERKRLELARALTTHPRVLLLDEIAGGLTEAECLELVAAIRRIRERGISLIWIEHVVHALLAVVDRLIVINFGAKIDDGEPRTVMGSPRVREIYMGIEADA
jgi:branched-chain amino acid transport system ATP-binding protein